MYRSKVKSIEFCSVLHEDLDEMFEVSMSLDFNFTIIPYEDTPVFNSGKLCPYFMVHELQF